MSWWSWVGGLALAVGLLGGARPAAAQTLNPDNGHYYQLMPDASWTAAKTQAESHFYGGISGHLATITSAQENEFVRNLVRTQLPPALNLAWIGLTYQGGTPPRVWVTGETLSYTLWRPGEPSGAANEAGTFIDANNGWWSDHPTAEILPYVVEFDTAPTGDTPAVPEPSSVLLFLPALGVMAFVRRRRSA